MSIITLTTDFGIADWFVGTMKGVILSLSPRTSIVDITHEISTGDIRAGAFALAASYRFFPKRTVHVAVVDPGVGSSRKAIAVRTANYFFVGPDNGVLSWALAKEKINSIRTLENEDYFLRPISQTFHGRDVFAPVSAHLASGMLMRNIGPALKEFFRLPWPEPIPKGNSIDGEIIYLDRFGNGITNLYRDHLRNSNQGVCYVHSKGRLRCPLKSFYQAVPAKAAVAILGSSGFVEISVHGGSAEEELGLKIGTRVVWSDEPLDAPAGSNFSKSRRNRSAPHEKAGAEPKQESAHVRPPGHTRSLRAEA